MWCNVTLVGGDPLSVAHLLLDQPNSRRRIVRAPLGNRLRDDHARGIDTEMQFPPASLPACSVLGGGPLAFADEQETAAAVED